MELYLQVIAGALITTVLCLTFSKQGKDISLLLSVCVCCMILCAAATYLRPVLDLIDKLQTVAGLDGEMMSILLKAVGICLISELAGLVCSDCGNGALGKGIHILASAVILWISIPMMTALLELVQRIVGEL